MRFMGGIGSLAAAAILSVWVGAPVWAQTQRASLFVVDPQTPIGPEIRTTTSKVVMVVELRAVRAARLAEPFLHTGVDWRGATIKRPLTQADVLTGTGGPGDPFCMPQHMGGVIAPDSPCLVDKDGDGQFDISLSSIAVAYGAPGTNLTDKQQLMPVTFSQTTALPNPVRYSLVAAEEAPLLKAKLRWRKQTYRNAPGKPTVVTLWLDGSASKPLDSGWDADHGIGSFSPEQNVYLDQPNSRVQIGGLTIEVLGVDKKGRLQYRLEAYRPDVVVPFFYRQPTTFTLYL